MLIRDLLNSKSDILLTVLPDTDMRESAELMIDQSISALVVLSKDGALAVYLPNAISRDISQVTRGIGKCRYRKP